jgi:hypothetical protein
MTRICCACKQEKDETNFSWKSRPRGLRARECKECHQKLRRQYYRQNRKIEAARVTRRRFDTIAWANEIKLQSGCAMCGFKEHPAALDFHHSNPAEKDLEPAVLIRRGWSRAAIAKALEDCVILCANCHRIHHAQMRKCGRSSLAESEFSKLSVVGSIPTVRSKLIDDLFYAGPQGDSEPESRSLPR